MFRTVAAVLLGLTVCAACDNNNPEAPPTDPSSGERVTGSERFGWTQLAADAIELAAIGYVVYVDGSRRDLPDARCDSSATASGFPCSAPLPSLSNGPHVLEVASFVTDGGTVLEGPRSAALRVIVGGASITMASPADASFTTSDGLALRLRPVVESLENPVDVAFAPDGRVVVGEERGTIRIVRLDASKNGFEPAVSTSIADTEGNRLLAVTLDPKFGETHYLFTLQATGNPPERTFLLARFREDNGALVDRIVLLDSVPAAAAPQESLRFGPDGKLYVALDDGGNAEQANDLSSRNGKLLRLNVDGSTPDDQANLTPVLSYGFRAPHALTWQPSTGGVWLADENVGHEALLYALERQATGQRSRVRAAFRLPAGTTPTAALFYRGRVIPSFENNLFVASDSGDYLLRFTLDAADPLRMLATERVLGGGAAPIRVVAQGSDGSLYVATATALHRVSLSAP